MTVNRLNKKRIFITVAALILIAALMTSFAACQSPDRQFEINRIEGDYGAKVYEYMDMLATEYPARTMATEGERNAAEYIAAYMSGLGYESEYSFEEIIGLSAFKPAFTRYDGTSVSDVNAFNVIFTKKAVGESAGEILLTCQYDNLYAETDGENQWQADGSYESGGAVAVMLTLADALKDKTIDYDVTFAFFTGGSYMWSGAKQYADSLKRADIDSMRLVINFSMLFGGENLYLYTGEKETSYGNMLAAASTGLTEVPADKHIAFSALTDDAVYNYVHIGMLANTYYFVNKNLPAANFLSLDWSCGDNPMMTEIKGQSNVYHTKDDTFANLVSRKGEAAIKQQAGAVVQSCLTILDESNAEVLSGALAKASDEKINETAQSPKTSSLLNIILKIVLIAAVFAIAGAIKRYVGKHRDRYVPEMPEENTNDTPEPFSDEFNERSESKNSLENSDGGIKQDDDFKDDPFI